LVICCDKEGTGTVIGPKVCALLVPLRAPPTAKFSPPWLAGKASLP